MAFHCSCNSSSRHTGASSSSKTLIGHNCLCRPMGGFCVRTVASGCPQWRNPFAFDAFFVFYKKNLEAKSIKRLQNEQNIRTREAQSASSESVGLYWKCEYCQAGVLLLFMSFCDLNRASTVAFHRSPTHTGLSFHIHPGLDCERGTFIIQSLQLSLSVFSSNTHTEAGRF